MNETKAIDVNVKVPDGEFCHRCSFMTPIINLYSEPKCLIYGHKLKYVHLDNYRKCNECIEASKEDEEN